MSRWVLLAVIASSPAFAEEPPEEVRKLFAHGISLFGRGDVQGAREDFERVATTWRRPSVVYNLGLVYAVLGDSPRAVELLDEVLENPTKLSAVRVAKARELRAQHAALLAELTVVVPVEGAAVQVDGRPVGRTPLARTVRVKAGEVLVDAAAPRHLPARQAVAVGAGEKVEVRLELMPLERTLAQVTVRTQTPEAQLFVDGVLVARAPFFTSLALEPGERQLELRREGFRPARQALSLAEGGTGAWEADLEEDPLVVERRGGFLRANAGPGAIDVVVDGRHRGLLDSLRLAPGRHLVRFERGGFFPEVREVEVRSAEDTVVELTFSPTPELRASLGEQQRLHRTLGVTTLVAGGALVAGGGAYLAYTLVSVDALERRVVDVTAQAGDGSSECRLARTCDGLLLAANDELAKARSLSVVGVVGLAVGAVSLGVGTWALLTAPDPGKFDRPRDSVLIDELGFAPLPGGGLVSLGGSF